MSKICSDLLDLIVQNWGTISSVIGFILVTFSGYKGYRYSQQSSKEYAIGLAKTFMLAVEKKATDLLLSTGKDKFDFVVSSAYDKFPAIVRAHISKPMFSLIVQQLFDEAVAIAKEHQVEQPVTQTVAPTVITTPIVTTDAQQAIEAQQTTQTTQSN